MNIKFRMTKSVHKETGIELEQLRGKFYCHHLSDPSLYPFSLGESLISCCKYIGIKELTNGTLVYHIVLITNIISKLGQININMYFPTDQFHKYDNTI